MNWINELEKRRTLIIGGVLLLVISTLLVTAMRNPVSYDAFWHLQTGRDWLVNGLSPWIDHYSYTFHEQKISNPPVAFQALLYLSTAQLGVTKGFLVIKLACFLLTMGAAFLVLRMLKAHPVIYAIVLPMIAFLLQLRSTVRPELLGYLFAVVALILYFRAGRKVTLRRVLPMVVLALIWTNYHRSSIVGYVIFAGFFLDCAVSQYQARASAREWAQWLGLGALTLAVGFINPDFSHPVLESFTFSPEWKLLIAEYRFGSWLLELPATYALILIAILTPVLAIRQREFGHLLCWAVLIYAARDASRLLSFSGIVITLLFARLLIADGFPGRWKLAGRRAITAAGVLSVLLVFPVLASNVTRAWDLLEENRQTANRYPAALVRYMRDRKLAGRVHNEFALGGYLIYQLAPQNQFYIDGRTHILFPAKHLRRFLDTLGSPGVMREELDKYQVDKIVLFYDDMRHDTVSELGDFGLEFMDAGHALYVRGAANFSLLGRLLSQPACWREDMTDQLGIEWQRMDVVLPPNSSLYPFASFVVGYDRAADKKAYFDQSIEQYQWTDEMRRFAGFRFIEQGHNDIAVFLFGGVTEQRPQDRLAAATALLIQGKHEAATQALTEFTTIAWPRISPGDLEVLKVLFQHLAAVRELSIEEQQVVEKIGGTMTSPTSNEPAQPLGTKMFCPAGAPPTM